MTDCGRDIITQSTSYLVDIGVFVRACVGFLLLLVNVYA